MNTPVEHALAALPSRQLHLILAGLLLIAASLCWLFALRAPLAQLRTLQSECARLEMTATDTTLQRQNQQLAEQIATLARQLGAIDSSRSPDQMLVELISAIDRAGQRHGVTLNGATPGGLRKAVIFDEMPFDVEAHGSYQALIDWMADIEQALPTLAIARFDIHPSEQPAQLTMKIRIAAYRSQQAVP